MPLAASSDRPLVSVVIPAYRHAPYVAACIEAIWAQDWPLEIVACDDASPDGTAAALHALAARSPVPMTVLENARNRGVCATLNRCVARAAGDWIVTTASDDAWLPGFLPAMMATALAQAAPTVVQSGAWIVAEDAPPRLSLPPEAALGPEAALEALAAQRFFMMAPSMLVPRSVHEAVGPYDETLGFEDLDFVLRAARAGTGFAWRREALIAKRASPGSLGARLHERMPDVLRCYDRSLGDRPDLHRAVVRRRLAHMAFVAARDGAPRGLGAALRLARARPEAGMARLAGPALRGLGTRLFRAGFGKGHLARWRARAHPPPPPLPI